MKLWRCLPVNFFWTNIDRILGLILLDLSTKSLLRLLRSLEDDASVLISSSFNINNACRQLAHENLVVNSVLNAALGASSLRVRSYACQSLEHLEAARASIRLVSMSWRSKVANKCLGCFEHFSTQCQYLYMGQFTN